MSEPSFDEIVQIIRKAAIEGDAATIRPYVYSDIDYFGFEGDNETPLMLAVGHGHEEVVDLLLLKAIEQQTVHWYYHIPNIDIVNQFLENHDLPHAAAGNSQETWRLSIVTAKMLDGGTPEELESDLSQFTWCQEKGAAKQVATALIEHFSAPDTEALFEIRRDINEALADLPESIAQRSDLAPDERQRLAKSLTEKLLRAGADITEAGGIDLIKSAYQSQMPELAAFLFERAGWSDTDIDEMYAQTGRHLTPLVLAVQHGDREMMRKCLLMRPHIRYRTILEVVELLKQHKLLDSGEDSPDGNTCEKDTEMRPEIGSISATSTYESDLEDAIFTVLEDASFDHLDKNTATEKLKDALLQFEYYQDETAARETAAFLIEYSYISDRSEAFAMLPNWMGTYLPNLRGIKRQDTEKWEELEELAIEFAQALSVSGIDVNITANPPPAFDAYISGMPKLGDHIIRLPGFNIDAEDQYRHTMLTRAATDLQNNVQTLHTMSAAVPDDPRISGYIDTIGNLARAAEAVINAGANLKAKVPLSHLYMSPHPRGIIEATMRNYGENEDIHEILLPVMEAIKQHSGPAR